MKGNIELIEDKSDKTKDLKRLRIDGIFYSFFGKLNVKEGDTVDFEYTEKGKYKTIVLLEQAAPEPSAKDKSIMRQTALKCACMAYHINENSSVQDQVQTILKIADTFEKHLRK